MPVPAEVLTQTSPDGLPEDPFAMLGLIRAAARGQAESFAATAATLTQGPVMLLDGDGAVLAFCAGLGGENAAGAAAATEIVLRDEAGLWGTLTLTPRLTGTRCQQESLLAELGLVLIKTVHSERARATLESRLVVLSCLASGNADWLPHGDRPTAPGVARRLVVIRAARALHGHAATRLADLIRRTAACGEAIPGLYLVPSDGALVGVYRDTGGDATADKRSWSEVLRAAAADRSVTVAIGAAVTDPDDFPGQHRLARDIAEIQQRGSGFFGLPRVAMLDDLGPLTEVIGAAPGRNLVPFAERVLGDLLGSRLRDRSARFDLELAVRLCLAARLLWRGAAQ